jgi:hypothetical protein
MSTKKCKPLGSAMEEFVFGTKEAASPPTEPEAVSSAPTPTASLIRETSPTPFALLPALTAPQPFASAAEPVPGTTPSARLSKQRSGLWWICPSSEQRKLSMLPARTGRKKVDIVRMLLEDGLKEEA